MTATYVQKFHTIGNFADDATVTLSGVTPGNYLFAAHAIRDGSVSTTFAAPSGWTLIDSAHGSGRRSTVYVYYRLAQSSDNGKSYTWSAPGASDSDLTVVEFAGVTSIKAHASNSTYASTSTTAPTVTATAANQSTLMFGGLDYFTYAYTGPSGWTKLQGEDVGRGSVWFKQWSNASGATLGGGTWQISGAGMTYATLILVALGENTAPNAPALTSPAAGATLDRNITQRFAWNFNDPDAGDTQSAYEIRYQKIN